MSADSDISRLESNQNHYSSFITMDVVQHYHKKSIPIYQSQANVYLILCKGGE